MKKLGLLIIGLFLIWIGFGILLGYWFLEEEPTPPPAPPQIIQKTDLHVHIRDKDVNYMYGIATAYTPSAGGINSDSDPTRTSTMKPAKNGIIAVNPEVIPYGSEVMIISGNTVVRGVAEDTGGAMRQNPKQVDILMEDLTKAKEWGRREVHIIWW